MIFCSFVAASQQTGFVSSHVLCCDMLHCDLSCVQQAQRLSWHPSIALWCGNNEIDLSYEWSNSTLLRSNRNMFVVDYQAVFIDTVRKNIKQVRTTEIGGWLVVGAGSVKHSDECV